MILEQLVDLRLERVDEELLFFITERGVFDEFLCSCVSYVSVSTGGARISTYESHSWQSGPA